MSDREDAELRSLRARVSVLEHMMAYLMRRLGAEEEHVLDWLRRREHGGDPTYLYGAVNTILMSLKPPPGRRGG
jgi:hypothetical protein